MWPGGRQRPAGVAEASHTPNPRFLLSPLPPSGCPSPCPHLSRDGGSAVDLLLKMSKFGVLSLPSRFGNVIFKCLAIHRNGSPFLENERALNLINTTFPLSLRVFFEGNAATSSKLRG